MDVLVEGADLPRYRLARDGRFDCAAIGVAKYHDRFGAEHRRPVFQTGDGIRSGHIARHPHHKNMTNALVKN